MILILFAQEDFVFGLIELKQMMLNGLMMNGQDLSKVTIDIQTNNFIMMVILIGFILLRVKLFSKQLQLNFME